MEKQFERGGTMAERKSFRELFYALFQAAKLAEGRLCGSGEEKAEEARHILSEAIDRCYEELREWEN